MGTKWGDKWEERFNVGIGTRQGETWHYSATGERELFLTFTNHKGLSRSTPGYMTLMVACMFVSSRPRIFMLDWKTTVFQPNIEIEI